MYELLWKHLRQQEDGSLSLGGRVSLSIPAFFLIFSAYNLAGKPVRPPSHPEPTWLDHLVPFVPQSFRIYMPGYIASFLQTLWLLRSGRAFRSALAALVLINALAFPFFLFFPVAAPRPILHGELEGSLLLLKHLYSIDTPYNTFPSLHVASSSLCAWFCWSQDRRVGLYSGLLSLGIAASTLMTRQHWAVDVLGGWVLAGVGVATYQLALHLDRGWLGSLPARIRLPVTLRIDRDRR